MGPGKRRLALEGYVKLPVVRGILPCERHGLRTEMNLYPGIELVQVTFDHMHAQK